MSKESEVQNKIKYRDSVTELVKGLSNAEGVYHAGAEAEKVNPLKHTFADGCYIREITMPASQLIVSRIHKVKHPYFIASGKVSVLTEDGVIHIEGPYSGITPAGTQRVLYTHTEVVWTTVHVTDKTDIDEIAKEILADNFDDPAIKIEDINKLKKQ